MLDTDKIGKYLEKIKNKCRDIDCYDCLFYKGIECNIIEVIKKLNDELAVEPCSWNIKIIKDILEEE